MPAANVFLTKKDRLGFIHPLREFRECSQRLMGEKIHISPCPQVTVLFETVMSRFLRSMQRSISIRKPQEGE